MQSGPLPGDVARRVDSHFTWQLVRCGQHFSFCNGGAVYRASISSASVFHRCFREPLGWLRLDAPVLASEGICYSLCPRTISKMFLTPLLDPSTLQSQWPKLPESVLLRDLLDNATWYYIQMTVMTTSVGACPKRLKIIILLSWVVGLYPRALKVDECVLECTYSGFCNEGAWGFVSFTGDHRPKASSQDHCFQWSWSLFMMLFILLLILNLVLVVGLVTQHRVTCFHHQLSFSFPACIFSTSCLKNCLGVVQVQWALRLWLWVPVIMFSSDLIKRLVENVRGGNWWSRLFWFSIIWKIINGTLSNVDKKENISVLLRHWHEYVQSLFLAYCVHG